MSTYPNQKVIHINKKSYKSNFLQVGIDEWQEAFKELKPSTFAIYLYLASNADGFDLALSQKAIENALGIKKTAYHNAIAELKEKGYIRTIQGNIESFFTAPVRKCELRENELNNELRKNELQSPQMRTPNSAKMKLEVRENGREIDIIDNINKIDKGKNPTDFSSLATQAAEQEQEKVEATGADKVICVDCPNVADSYFYLIKNLQKNNKVLADFVVNGLTFNDDNNHKRTDKAINLCAKAGYQIVFNTAAAANA